MAYSRNLLEGGGVPGLKGLAGMGGWGVMSEAYALYREYRAMNLHADPAQCIYRANGVAQLGAALPSVNYNSTFVVYSARDLQQAVPPPPPVALGLGKIQSMVQMEVWKQAGYLYFKAESLAFAFCVPVLGGDNWQAQNVSSIINTWMLAQSARWLSLMFYIGIAADHVGRPSAGPGIMIKHVYHEQHKMVTQGEELAMLEIPGAQLDYREEFRQGEAPWYVIISK